MQPFLSIIIPAYNEEQRLHSTLRQVHDFLQSQPYSSEVLVVENGSEDRTLAIARDFAAGHPNFRTLHEEESGKGRAVRRGMLEASGEYRFMCDADLSMPISELPRFLPPLLPDPHIAIASRESPGAVRYGEPEYRHLGGRLINLLIRLLALPKLHDTQCGFKCFRADVAEDLFKYQTINGWSFDIEVLYLAKKRGYPVVELPIPWYYVEGSKVKPVKDAIMLFFDILEIRRNARRGVYAAQV